MLECHSLKLQSRLLASWLTELNSLQWLEVTLVKFWTLFVFLVLTHSCCVLVGWAGQQPKASDFYEFWMRLNNCLTHHRASCHNTFQTSGILYNQLFGSFHRWTGWLVRGNHDWVWKRRLGKAQSFTNKDGASFNSWLYKGGDYMGSGTR